jgi:16S rRNA (guanine966-N2)-methyltransferase
MDQKPHHFRIIAGRFRSRQLLIPKHAAVRPTPNRVRETLFNWLMNTIHDSHCLDGFAGSGALGIEALSRGAKQVYFIEKERSILQALETNLSLLKAEGATLINGTMPASLGKVTATLDIIFLDPPFRQNLILPSLLALQQSTLLKKGTLVYIEMERNVDLQAQLDPLWTILKHQKAGSVAYYLIGY